MRSQVTICAIALCFEFVASLPRSIDAHRNSGLQIKPQTASIQANPPRPLQYYSPSNPIAHDQKQPQLPKINSNYYFSRNQQRYLPKGPPQQPQVVEARYTNQQLNSNNYVANQHVYPLRPEIQQRVPIQSSQIVNSKVPQINIQPIPQNIPFSPAIPPVPIQKVQLLNDAFRRVDEHYSQKVPLTLGEEIEIPLIRPLTPRTGKESTPKVNNIDTLLARAADPVEQIPQPRTPHGPAVERFLSHPKVRDALATTKHEKRYLVIHPNGTVEHVDKIEAVALRHPNYYLVNAGGIVPNPKEATTKTHYQLPPPPTKPVHDVEIADQSIVTQITKPIEPPAEIIKSLQVSWTNGKQVEQEKETLSTIDTKVKDQVLTPIPTLTIKFPSTHSATENEISSLHKDSELKDKIIAESVIAPVITPINQPNAAPSDDSIKTIVPNTIIVNDEPQHEKFLNNLVKEMTLQIPVITKTHSGNEVNAITLNENLNQRKNDGNTIVSIEKDPVIGAPVLSNTEPLKRSDNNIEPITFLEVQDQVQGITDAVNNIGEYKIDTTNSLVKHTSVVAEVDESPLLKDSNVITAAQIEVPDKKDDETKISTGSNAISIAHAGNSANVRPDEIKIATIPSKPKIINVITTKSDKTNEPAITSEIDDSDNSKDSKPTVWFNTSDGDLWEKLADKDKGLDVVYFFQIHNQPKVEKDIRTTIHANGTVVEDVIEKYWAFEGDEPTITTSTKIIHPEDL